MDLGINVSRQNSKNVIVYKRNRLRRNTERLRLNFWKARTPEGLKCGWDSVKLD